MVTKKTDDPVKRPAVQTRSFQGTVMLLVPAVVVILQLAGVEISEAEIVGLVGAIFAAGGAVWSIWGNIRRSDVGGIFK